MGNKTETTALYQVGDYLMKDDELYQVTHIHKSQYSLKRWEMGEWGRTRRYGLKKTENDPTWDLVSKYKAKKILAGKFVLFLKEIKALDVTINPFMYWSCNWLSDKSDEPKEPIIGVEWSNGGLTGGSCWDTGEDDNHYSMSGDEEPELVDLDVILEHFNPGITFLQYKRLCQELIERGESRENEYYGNYTDYAHKFIRLRRLYKYLNEKGWLPQHLVEE